MSKKIIKQKGGDGYVINPNISIGGMPGHTRYSYNLVPVFDGSLLQNGGGGKKEKSCGDCTKKKSEESVYDLIKMQGGFSGAAASITQFSAIKEVSSIISPLGANAIISLILLIFMQSFTEKREPKAIQIGGANNMSEMGSILVPLGKNNLIVLASLLLLHYVAKNSLQSNETSAKISKKKMVGGGGADISGTLSSILAPLGVNSLGTSALLIMIQQAFMPGESNSKKSIKQQGGSSPLKDLIAPLGTNAFIATGLLILIEKLFVGKDRKNNQEKLFNTLAPISFNAFAKKDFLDKMAKTKKKPKPISKSKK